MMPSLLVLYPILSLVCFLALPVSAWRSAVRTDAFQLPRSLSKDGGHITYDGNSVGSVREALLATGIIPTVLDDFRPKYLLDVDWPAADAYLGNSPDIDRVDKQPKFTLFPQHYTSARAPNHTYVVTMTYPDAFPRGSHESSEMRHFVATGLPLTIPCDSATCPKVRPPKLKVLVPYEAPDPGHGSGPYRYVFVAFAPANESTEPLQLSTPQNTLRWGRDKDKYGVQGWAAANGLVPVAVNFIQLKNQ
ncbi:hypothetical protein S7711_03375 [Stachybotrys chartarum IBT 7711]|uniref:Phosphatidylethanolamine-binding protein n=1 Tax=Stachybotrys chartarum (strain CBS 109288 / IBT 7711) TaxID=1280523 RepID=A0A084AXW2_STACB|nr:hypothetical protein S7711_03375 [Stachybotrys chartarum IBT 7711]KFA46813.1 hypothetical protein S40293_05597 [Stachybotrys chartarum IBT 40293]KFA72565.1 hypothetical protein S40288_06872 [Stachybotrys chartarum IBT 40288]